MLVRYDNGIICEENSLGPWGKNSYEFVFVALMTLGYNGLLQFRVNSLGHMLGEGVTIIHGYVLGVLHCIVFSDVSITFVPLHTQVIYFLQEYHYLPRSR